MKKLIVFVFIIGSINLYSQERQSGLIKDSLWHIWSNDSFSIEERYSALDVLCKDVYLKSQPDSAQIISEMHFKKAKASENHKEMAVAKMNEAMSFAYRGRIDTALTISHEALEYNKRSNDVKNQSYIHFRQGGLKASLGKFDDALSSLQTSAELSTQLNDKQSLATTYSTQARILKAQDKYDEALKLINQAILLETDLGVVSSATYTAHAAILEKLMDYNGSINSYKLAIKKARENNNDLDIALAQSHLSHLYLVINELEFSKECAIETVDIYEKLNYLTELPWGYTALGNVLVTQDSVSKGLIWHEKAISVFEKLNDQFALAELLSIKAYDLFALQRYDESISLCKTLLEQDFGTVNSPLNRRVILSQLSDNYYELNDFETALTYSLNAHDIAISQSDYSSKFQTTQDLHRIYKALGNKNLALKYYEEYIEIDRELKVKEGDSELIKARYQLEYEKQALKDSLDYILDSELLLAKSNSQKKMITIYSIGIVLLIGLSLVLFSLLRKNRKQKKQLTETLNRNTTLLNEKDTLLREIHHRVKNNLQVISSLLSWQSRETADKQAKSVLTESQTRVQSMSLIHQNLYQKDNLTGIDMKPYIDKLSHYLLSTFGVADEISFSSEASDLRLDVDTVVPLGLIINELITNSLKYAFPEEKTGEIFIKLAEENNKLHLVVKDNGIGISDIENLGGNNSFGYSLIKAFAQRLEADLFISGESGTEVRISISEYVKR